MPRDSKGKPFGIDSIVKTPDGGRLTVKGFIVCDHDLTKNQVQTIAQAAHASPVAVFAWHEVTLEKPEEDPYRHHDHVDTCRMDAAQGAGMQLPPGGADKVNELKQAIGMSADKWVWGN